MKCILLLESRTPKLSIPRSVMTSPVKLIMFLYGVGGMLMKLAGGVLHFTKKKNAFGVRHCYK